MDTTPLERFATWARRELLTSVDAQISTVLASGSIARAERGEVVRRLGTEIERHGRQHVVDKVAYIWFNRIIALRFMDARGYTDAGVVSPMRGLDHGQPEILADAKRGVLDTEVVTNKRIADSILGLLDGTRSSVDAEGEAYALLLTEYCHFWHKAMPFIFEREGDYTELLVPGNLLADGSILSRAREALTEEVCKDVEVIGWLYQFYISERKDEVFADFKYNKKAGADEIPAATQLFTPHWIVRYLVENSVGRLWMLNRPQSRLIEQMDYYIKPVDEETDFLKINGPEEITVIDPACGSGHMLTYAFDLLYAIYEEEGYAPSDIPTLILQNNLYGTEIDPRAGALAAFALAMKARAKQRTFFNKQIEPKIAVIEPIKFRPDEVDVLLGGVESTVVDQVFWNQFEHADVLGSLIMPNRAEIETAKTALSQAGGRDDIIYSGTFAQAEKYIKQAEMLSNNYAVVVANPPYMGSKNMDSLVSEFVKKHFPDTKSDLFAVFIERCLLFLDTAGYAGLMTPFVWMFISSYEKLRQRLLQRETISSLIQLEYSGFDGATVPICTFVLRRRVSTGVGAYIRLSDFVGPALQGPKALEIIQADRNHSVGEKTNGMERHLYRVTATDLEKIPGAPIAYWLPGEVLEQLSKETVSDVFISGGRLKTHGNMQYVRYFWEISNLNKHWDKLANGGGYAPFYGNNIDCVNTSIQAIEEYSKHGGLPSTGSKDKKGITWNLITSARTSFRIKDEGELFSSASPTIFPTDESVDLFAYLSYLNSDVVYSILQGLNPTLNTVVGDIMRLPRIPQAAINDLGKFGRESFFKVLEADEYLETSPRFKSIFMWQSVSKAEPFRLVLEQVRSRRFSIRSFILKQIDEANHAILKAWDVTVAEEKLEEQEPDFALDSMASLVGELVSYAVGCMFGRYTLDEQGLILANQGETLQDYLAKVPSPSFMPDADNVIPFVDDGWFEDDIVERFREFLRVTFGTEHFEENLRFIEESLGVKTIRDYFITRNGKSKFYDDHVKRYKKRPIYWMFSSPKGSFNALIYMHRYTPSTVSTVLNEYLREYRAKLEVALSNAEEAAAAGSVKDQKEADRLRKVLVELSEYEHDILYPLATKQLPIDLDDGVLVNYLKFGRALKNIGFEKDRKKVEGWDWPHYPLEPIK